jgi:hypothetical protein
MNRRFASAVVLLLYTSVALVCGQLHDHHSSGAVDGRNNDIAIASDHNDCFACKWQIIGVSDVPLVVVPLCITTQSLPPVENPHTVNLPAAFDDATASRAPPLALA